MSPFFKLKRGSLKRLLSGDYEDNEPHLYSKFSFTI